MTTETVAELPHGKHLIAGVRTGAAEGHSSYDPATGEPIGTYAEASPEEVRAAIAAARTAFADTGWSRDRQLRARVLNELADRVRDRADELVALLARENGKIVSEAAFEISLVEPKLRYAAALALTDTGTAAETTPGSYSMVHKEAIGVAGIITPWNSPVFLAIRALAPALAAGCTAVLKMPAQTALVADLLSSILAETGALPPGVVNLFVEGGDEGAKQLVDSPDVDIVCYTGSTDVGRQIMAAGGATLKRLCLELGGKTPMIVFDDADLAAVVPTLVAGVTVFAGQFCMTGSRVLVQRGVAGKVRDALAAALLGVRLGPASDPESQMGPMIDRASVERVDRIVEEAAGYGRILVRGGPVTDGTLAAGAFYAPSLVEVDDVSAPIVQQEVFGPVATIEVFDTEVQAIEMANATEYGLSAGIWTRDVDRPPRVGSRLRAGTIWTNGWALVADQFEEGGFKQSGVGRLNGRRSIEEFQELKHYVHQVAELGQA
jgi:betaine-aldehyde dehydrogenase